MSDQQEQKLQVLHELVNEGAEFAPLLKQVADNVFEIGREDLKFLMQYRIRVRDAVAAVLFEPPAPSSVPTPSPAIYDPENYPEEAKRADDYLRKKAEASVPTLKEKPDESCEQVPRGSRASIGIVDPTITKASEAALQAPTKEASMPTLTRYNLWSLRGDVLPDEIDHGENPAFYLAGRVDALLRAREQALREKPQLVRPRVHGNGFIQIDVTPEVRMHVWKHPDIPRQAVETPIHNHTFGFTSRILTGALNHRVYEAVAADAMFDGRVHGEGQYQPHIATVRHGEDTVLASHGDQCWLRLKSSIFIKAGESYSMVPGEIHETLPLEPSISLIVKDGPSLAQGGLPPLVYVPLGVTPDNQFDRYAASPELLQRITAEVMRLGQLLTGPEA